MMTSLETDAFELKRMMRQEAHEKAYEIQVMAQRLFEKEKDKIVQQGLDSMNDDYYKKLMNLTMNLNIERSTKINQTRLQKMKERNFCIDKVKDEAKEQMLKTVVNPTNYMYKGAMKNLIIQVRSKDLKRYCAVQAFISHFYDIMSGERESIFLIHTLYLFMSPFYLFKHAL
jgi:hypothetical protein